jgi:hypothetical protein
MMTSTCPKCGGSDLRRITGTFFECVTETEVGWHDAPPEVTGTGMPQRRPIYGPCEHRFQMDMGLTSPCEIPYCGRDSVGTCQGGCKRRLCGLCGAPRGSFRCRDCIEAVQIEERQAAQRRQEKTAQATQLEARDLAQRQSLAREQLEAATSRREVARIFLENPLLLNKKECQEAWRRALTRDPIAPTHEITPVAGRAHLLMLDQSDPGWQWREVGDRFMAWKNPDGDYSTYFVDALGRTWRPVPFLLLGIRVPFRNLPFRKGSTSFVALPVGHSFRPSRCFQAWGLILFPGGGARTVQEGTCLTRIDLDDATYVRALGTLLQRMGQAGLEPATDGL